MVSLAEKVVSAFTDLLLVGRLPSVRIIHTALCGVVDERSQGSLDDAQRRQCLRTFTMGTD